VFLGTVVEFLGATGLLGMVMEFLRTVRPFLGTRCPEAVLIGFLEAMISEYC
jgi:hypothetical protein